MSQSDSEIHFSPIDFHQDCSICNQRLGFSLPKGLVSDLMSGNVAIFAGAGVSTENRQVLKSTFYEDICFDIDKKPGEVSFPEAMEIFAKRHNGKIELVQELKRRFDGINNFSESVASATRFHRSLATFYPIDTIVTTNWDAYFEEYCGATPFVTSEDIAMWASVPGRKVLKIHGSINNLGSIVLTTSDYEKCSERLDTGILGSILKTILATKTIIFIGYSLRDSDFLNILESVRSDLKEFNRSMYLVTPETIPDRAFPTDIQHIKTDGIHFMDCIKERAKLDLKGHFLPDVVYDVIQMYKNVLELEHQALHDKFSSKDYPQTIICASYQDGLSHGFDFILRKRSSGYVSHSCNLIPVLRSYEHEHKKRFLKAKRYEDVAYVQGYINAFMPLLMFDDDSDLNIDNFPFCFAISSPYELCTFEDYANVIDEIPNWHKGAQKRAERAVKVHLKDSSEGIVFHHPPWI